MNRWLRFATCLCFGSALAIVLLTTPAEVGAQGLAPVVRLKSFEFAPSVGQSPQIPPGLVIAGFAANQRGYYIVQFQGPVEQSWKDALTSLGADVLDYIPDFAFKVRMNPNQARQAEGLSSVIWVGIFHPAYKLSRDLVRDGVQLYLVRVEQGADLGLTTAAIAASGAQIQSRDGHILMVAAESDQVDAIARVIDVAWVQNYRMFQKHNEVAGGVIMGAANVPYRGASQTIAVADTGLGGGTAGTAHDDIAGGRVLQIYNWPGVPGGCFGSIIDDGAVDVDSGHGTHTTVSAVGASSLRGRGVAPEAKLIFQAVENYVTMSWICALFYGYPDGYYLTGLPSDLKQLYQQAYTADARIHSNSWGASVAGDYDLNSANTDSFVWNHPDMTVTFSAGNDGVDANNDGVVDNDSIGSPGSAKNVITVGASEHNRGTNNYPCDPSLSYTECTGSNDSIIATYGAAFGFSAGPIANDLAAGNEEQMAAFSSRGPTDDGRIKPDVVAPGTYVLSGYSDLYQQQYDSSPNPRTGAYQYDGWAYPESSAYKYMGGTSMSNPLVAGAAAVVRDYYQNAKGTPNASAALVKATLINSAVDLADENNDGVGDNDYPIPNNHEGWGRVNLAIATDGKAKFVDNKDGLSTNATATYIAAAPGGAPLKITLVWSDYPSTESATINLVNDLDLKVTSPNGAVYRGNYFSGGWSQTGGSSDRRNNVENVFIPNAGQGSYSVDISGYNVPNGPQSFSLVVQGADTLTTSSSPPPEPPPPTVANLHVGNLTGRSMAYTRYWVAGVSTFVHDANHQPVAGATVTGTWSNGYKGTGTCVTAAATLGDPGGFCAITSGRISSKTASVTFTVKSISLSGSAYSPVLNHDEGGDSNGTTMIVRKQ